MSRVWSSIGFALVLSVFFCSCSEDKTTTPDRSTTPVVSTAAVSAITRTTAECGGTVTANGGAAVTARGVCWGSSATPTIADNATVDGTGTGSFTSSITGLSAGSPYYARAYATNSVGTGYGNARQFTTTLADSTGTVADIDGNVYQTVKIGNQWWMAENLKAIRYRNGESIPNVTDNGTWAGIATGARCDYANNETNVAVYGRLYNWPAVHDLRNIAPAGWHVPSDAEWQTLIDHLGGQDVAGGKMKEAGTAHWTPYNVDATNESGFTGLPGGARLYDGAYTDMGGCGLFWSTTAYDDSYAWFVSLGYAGTSVLRDYNNKPLGYSIRCVRD